MKKITNMLQNYNWCNFYYLLYQWLIQGGYRLWTPFFMIYAFEWFEPPFWKWQCLLDEYYLFSPTWHTQKMVLSFYMNYILNTILLWIGKVLCFFHSSQKTIIIYVQSSPGADLAVLKRGGVCSNYMLSFKCIDRPTPGTPPLGSATDHKPFLMILRFI